MSYAKDSWRTAWLRGGRISEVAWINQDTMAWCSGIHLVFFDIPSNKLLLPRFSYDTVAAGACCLSGHPSHSIFAFAEKNLEPRILVYGYPSMMKICECTNGTKYAYLSTTFIEDFLVTLSSIPDFLLIFWSWRTGEKIITIETSVFDTQKHAQVLKANFHKPTFVAQIANESSILLTWEVTICNKTIILNKNNIILPNKARVQDVAWSPDSSNILAIVDKNGFIYLSNANGSDIKRIVLSQRCIICPQIEPTAICWHRGGIILRTTFCQIRYYQENENQSWRKIWFIKCATSPSVITSHPRRNDRLFFITTEGKIIQINYSGDISEAVQDVKLYLRGKYLFADFLKPWEEHIVAVDDSMELSVIIVDTGFEITKINLNIMGNITFMLLHPQYPITVVCSDKGEVVFVSLLNYYSPKILATYRLQSEMLDLMEFSHSGRYLAVCQTAIGICYLFIISFPNSVEIRTRLESNIKIADIMLFELEKNVTLHILEAAVATVLVGNKIFHFEMKKDQDAFKKYPHAFGFMNYFQNLHSIPDTNDTFVGSPYLTKQIRCYKINDSKEVLLTHVKSNEHKVRQVKTFKNNKWLITSGLDGLLIVRKINLNSNEYFYTHHRQEFGIKKANINSAGNVLITIGVDGSIVTIKNILLPNEISVTSNLLFKNVYEFLHNNFEYHEKKVEEYMKMFDENGIKFLSEPLKSYMDSENSTITWVEWKKKLKIKEEAKTFHTEKEKVLSKFKYLKSKVIHMLNKNENTSDIKKLPIATFNLDKVHREKRIKSAKDEREEERRKLELDCLEMERVTNWIKKKFWDPQLVIGQSIFGLFNNLEVTNYPFCEERKERTELIQHAKFKTKVLNEIMDVELILPWDIFSNSELQTKFTKQVRLKKTDTEQISDILEEIDDEPDQEKERNRYRYEGMTTFYFVEPNGYCNSQFKSYSFSQLISDDCSYMEDRKKLRDYFNKLFDELRSSKEREMNLLHERVDRIHYISSELQQMFNIYVDDVIEFPEWHIKENPETIIQTTEDEIPVKPYISDSLQDLYDKQAAEEEMARLAMMADDFRDRALQSMMDGVLELRWEDLIKRNPPKPECVVQGKKVEDYTDEDTLAVRRYELKVRELETEREKYKVILQSEYKKNNMMIREGIKKFNCKLEEFFLTKMKVESAIQQLNLHFLRYYKGHFNRMDYMENAQAIKKKIAENYEMKEKITKEIQIIENIDEELQNRYERLNVKDKYMEKKFKNDFPNLGKTTVMTLFAFYKRRPRFAFKNTSPFELLDLGKSITSMMNLPYLTSESVDYVKALANLDIRPANLSSNITDTHWQNLVALRRLKIDHELKMRAMEMNIEHTIEVLGIYNRTAEELKLRSESMREQLKLSRRQHIHDELDVQIQLVVKMGQVETQALSGDLRKDMIDAIVVPRVEVERVNQAILTAGSSKLASIRRNLDFRRHIKVEQWKLDCLKMRANHLEVGLYFAKSATLTREMRNYFMRKAKGLKDDKTPHRLKRDIEALRKSQEKIVQEYKEKLKLAYEEILRVRQKNKKLDAKITKMNVDRCEMELQRNIEGEERHHEYKAKICDLLAKKSILIRELVQNYEEILKMKKQQEYMSCLPHSSIKYSP